MKRKALCLALAFFFLLPLLPHGTVHAEEVCLEIPLTVSAEYNAGPDREVIGTYTDPDALRAYLSETFSAYGAVLDLKRFSLPAKAAETLYRYIVKEMPETFHVESLRFYRSASSDLMTKAEITYRMTQEEYRQTRSRLEQNAAVMLAGVKDNDALSDEEKALILHDRLALFCEYDLETVQTGATEGNVFTAAGALVDGLAVCEGYSKAYSYLLDQVGIRNYYCASDLLNHAWNILYIDGQKYHVDVTWDDSKSDLPGYATHENFLCSTAALITTGHQKDGAIDYDDTPTSTRFDNAWWKRSKCAVSYVNGTFYFIDHENEVLCSEKNGTVRELASVDDKWLASPGLVWKGNYACLTDNGRDLFFSLAKKVYRYEVKTGKVSLAWTPEMGERQGIYGLDFSERKLICAVYDSPNFKTNGNRFVRLEKLWIPPVIDAGDMDLSGTVDSDDAIYLLFHTLFGEDYPIYINADFVRNGLVDSDDAIYLLFHTLFREDYPL